MLCPQMPSNIVFQHNARTTYQDSLPLLPHILCCNRPFILVLQLTNIPDEMIKIILNFVGGYGDEDLEEGGREGPLKYLCHWVVLSVASRIFAEDFPRLITWAHFFYAFTFDALIFSFSWIFGFLSIVWHSASTNAVTWIPAEESGFVLLGSTPPSFLENVYHTMGPTFDILFLYLLKV